MPQFSQQDPVGLYIHCGGQAASSFLKDASGISLINDLADALANFTLKPITKSDALDLAEKVAERGGENGMVRKGLRSMARTAGTRITPKAAGNVLKTFGKVAGAAGTALDVYNAGDELANCVQ